MKIDARHRDAARLLARSTDFGTTEGCDAEDYEGRQEDEKGDVRREQCCGNELEKREELYEEKITIRARRKYANNRKKANQVNGRRNELLRQVNGIDRVEADIGQR